MVQVIKKSIDFIERNLKEKLTIEAVANHVGYSPTHFQKIFNETTGITVSAFITKRKVDAAATQIYKGRRAIDAAFEYGFDTYAGFYKAFLRVYDRTPKYKFREEMPMQQELDLRKILRNWDVPDDIPIINVSVLDEERIAQNVWAVGEEYFLKTDGGNIYQESGSSLLTNLAITKKLSSAGVSVAAPILTKNGANYYEEGDQIYTLTRAIKGAPLSDMERFGDSRLNFAKIYGENLAKLHQNLIKIQDEIPTKDAGQYQAAVEWAIPLIKKINLQWNMGLDEDFFNDYTMTFGQLENELPRQLIHRDPNPENILFYQGDFSGFIDFDLSEANWRLWDVCYCATGLLVSWDNIDNIKAIWPEILGAILQSYDRVNPLTASEKKAIYYVICTIQMICVAWFDGYPELQMIAKTNREMLKYIIQNADLIKGLI